MSYINDALRKAQLDKDSRYRRYSDIVIATESRINPIRKKRLFIFAAVAVIVAAGALYVYDRSGFIRMPAPKPVKAAVAPTVKPARPVPDINALYGTALELQKKGQSSEAERIYLQMLILKPSHSGALNNLGVIYMQEDKMVDALAMLHRAVAVDEVSADPYYNLACIHARLKDFLLSLEYLKKAIAINPMVKTWAKEDPDLKNLKRLPEFKKVTK
jgi:tetratricopeptide (TPR) repeat protein